MKKVLNWFFFIFILQAILFLAAATASAQAISSGGATATPLPAEELEKLPKTTGSNLTTQSSSENIYIGSEKSAAGVTIPKEKLVEITSDSSGQQEISIASTPSSSQSVSYAKTETASYKTQNPETGQNEAQLISNKSSNSDIGVASSESAYTLNLEENQPKEVEPKNQNREQQSQNESIFTRIIRFFNKLFG